MKFIKTGSSRSDAKRHWLIMVDDEDYKYLNQFKWQVDKEGIVKRHLNKIEEKYILMARHRRKSS
jgi:hypothetical protein